MNGAAVRLGGRTRAPAAGGGALASVGPASSWKWPQGTAVCAQAKMPIRDGVGVGNTAASTAASAIKIRFSIPGTSFVAASHDRRAEKNYNDLKQHCLRQATLFPRTCP